MNFFSKALASKTCYERVYKKNHFIGPNKFQSFRFLRLEIDESNELNAAFLVTYLKNDTKLKRAYKANFDFKMQKNETTIYCNSTNGEGDGNGSAGCIEYTKKEKSISVSPVTYLFSNDNGFNSTEGVLLTNCQGRFNDGGECVLSLPSATKIKFGKVRTYPFLPSLKADLGYRLDEVACK